MADRPIHLQLAFQVPDLFGVHRAHVLHLVAQQKTGRLSFGCDRDFFILHHLSFLSVFIARLAG